MGIKRISIRNYRGIEEREVSVGEHGALVKGRNGAGKSTLLKAIMAALNGRDIAADAIRKGASKSEILVDLDDVSVRRAITPKGSTLTVARDGMQASAPQTFLRELLGSSSLDPMDLLTKKDKDRRAAVLAALPVTVTVEQLRQWVPRISDTFDCSGHGLEVVERVRAKAYEQRTDANKNVKAAKTELDRLAQAARDAEDVAPPECFEADIDALATAAESAKARVIELTAQQEQATKANGRIVSERSKVEALRKLANSARDGAGVPVNDETMDKLVAMKNCAEKRLEAARKDLKDAEDAMETVRVAIERAETRQRDYARAIDRAVEWEQQATDLESALAAATIEAPSDEAIRAARTEASKAMALLDESRYQLALRDKASDAKTKASDARVLWDAATAEAERLDGVVSALTNDAPAALLAACDGIPGLSLDGDDILLDGVKLDSLCGAEQVKFCVEVARRANAKSKILIVDGLERLDDEQREVFIREATRDGFQLLASVVQRGEVVIEAITPEPTALQAAE